MSNPTLAIVNPTTVRASRWPAIEARLRAALGPIEVERTAAPGDAERIAEEAVEGGIERIVVAGGDGTVREVATGLLSCGLGERAALGLLPLGTGGDLARTLAPRNLEAAIEALGRGATRQIDAGRIRYQDFEGKECVRFFVNVASFGLSGVVDREVRRLPRGLGGRVAYLVGALAGIAAYRCQSVSVRLDGEEVHRGPIVLAAAANGSYFGGGMHIAPNAQLDDGRFDLVLVRELSKLQLLSHVPSIYTGAHLGVAAVSVHGGGVVEAESIGGEVLLDVDGDPLGRLPARIEIVPKALTLFGAR